RCATAHRTPSKVETCLPRLSPHPSAPLNHCQQARSPQIVQSSSLSLVSFEVVACSPADSAEPTTSPSSVLRPVSRSRLGRARALLGASAFLMPTSPRTHRRVRLQES